MWRSSLSPQSASKTGAASATPFTVCKRVTHNTTYTTWEITKLGTMKWPIGNLKKHTYLAKHYGWILECGITNPNVDANDLDATHQHSRHLAGVFGNPVLIDEEWRGIGGVGFGFGSVGFLLFGVGNGARGFAGVIWRGWDQIEEEDTVQSGTELAYQ